MTTSVSLCWFRRDLRLEDQAAFYHALRASCPVVPVFVFDKNILDDLEDQQDRRITFIHAVLEEMQVQLVKKGSTMHVFYGTPMEAFQYWTTHYKVAAVYTNHDYEPYAKERDKSIAAFLKDKDIPFHTFKDQVIFEKQEVVKDNGEPYTVFTPYSKKWKTALSPFYLQSYPVKKYLSNLYQQPAVKIPGIADLGFLPGEAHFPSKQLSEDLIAHYNETRDFPGMKGTSRLGVHLRFGTISIRKLAQRANVLNETFLNELIWRDFYQMILWHFPHVVGGSFKSAYDKIQWRNNEKEFQRWCEGRTGYPIVDAGMRELNATGFMHNRVRMITASFLTKHLLIDWRWGEAYFAKKLLDYDLAANNGGWQWAASSGCDAAPYFRVFNPTLQMQKFDPSLQYVRKWVPELDSFDYVIPIVSHDVARKRVLEVYADALKK
jgi:deoxyribodipyrimidine photo-lyase